MIDYVEIYELQLNELHNRLVLMGVIDDFNSVIWKNTYYGVGEFEIYVPASMEKLEILKKGNYVLTPDGGDDEIGIIERVEITTDHEKGIMITATGRMAKSILDRRIIYTPIYDEGEGGNGYIWHCQPLILKGKVDSLSAAIVAANAANPTNPYPQYLKGDRSLPVLGWNPRDAWSKYPETITIETEDGTEEAEKQVTYKNLLDYTDSLLEEYGLGAYLSLNRDEMLLHYKVRKGISRTRENHPEGEPIVFSQEMDNLISTDYVYDETSKKTTAIIGGEGDGTERKNAFAYEWISGMERREVFVDASSITTDVEEGEAPITLEDYRKQLETQGQQTISQSPAEETLNGVMDITNSPIKYREDFYVGDIVDMEDSRLGLATSVRILSVTEVQDENGYQIDIEYGNK